MREGLVTARVHRFRRRVICLVVAGAGTPVGLAVEADDVRRAIAARHRSQAGALCAATWRECSSPIRREGVGRTPRSGSLWAAAERNHGGGNYPDGICVTQNEPQTPLRRHQPGSERAVGALGRAVRVADVDLDVGGAVGTVERVAVGVEEVRLDDLAAAGCVVHAEKMRRGCARPASGPDRWSLLAVAPRTRPTRTTNLGPGRPTRRLGRPVPPVRLSMSSSEAPRWRERHHRRVGAPAERVELGTVATLRPADWCRLAPMPARREAWRMARSWR